MRMITIINIKTVIMEKIEDHFYRNKWQPPDRDVEIVLTKKFCEDLKTQTRHRLCVSLALVLISYIILVAGTAFTFIFGLSAQTQSAIYDIALVSGIFGALEGCSWATICDFNNDIWGLIKVARNKKD